MASSQLPPVELVTVPGKPDDVDDETKGDSGQMTRKHPKEQRSTFSVRFQSTDSENGSFDCPCDKD